MATDKSLPSGGQELTRSPEDYQPKHELYGIFRAVVEDTNDPEYRCRIKVRIDGIHSNDVGKVPTKSLVWAERLTYDGGGINHGDHDVPYAYGDTVAVILLRGRSAPQPIAFVVGAWSGMLPDKDDMGENATEHYGSNTTETVVETVGQQAQQGGTNDAYKYPETSREIWQYFDRDDQPKFDAKGDPMIKPYQVYPRRRVIKSRHGHVIEISDEPADYEIIIRTPIGQRLWLRESVRCATEERPVWKDGLDTGETVTVSTSKMFPKSMQLIDDKGNYIWMNTEDGLLDIYWNGDKRERINGNFEQEIAGHYARKVGHFTQFEYGYNPNPNNAPLNPLDMPEDDGTHLWVKELYHSFKDVLIEGWNKLWVLLDMSLGIGGDYAASAGGSWSESAAGNHATSAGGSHTSFGSIVDHNSGPGPASPDSPMAPSEAQNDMAWEEPVCEETT